MRTLLLLYLLCFCASARGALPSPPFIGNLGPKAPGAAPTSFVTSQTLTTTLNNNFSGAIGFAFQVSNQAVVVTQLGRWVWAGNSQTHVIHLYTNSILGVLTELGNVTIDCNGATTNQFLYGTLSSPISLKDLGTFFIASEEVNGGPDTWGGSDTVLTHTTVAVIPNAAYTADHTTINVNAGADNSYGPVNFKYSSP